MQVTAKDIKVKEGTTKSGPNTGKPWKLIIIIGEDGTEFTTFDAGAQEVGIGGVIELEPVIKAGKINFTEFKILEKGRPAALLAPVPTNGKPDDMTPDMWKEKDRAHNHSIESQVAFKGIIELFIAGKIGVDSLLANAAFDWALARLTPQQPTPKPASKPTESKSEASTEKVKADYDMKKLQADLANLEEAGQTAWTRVNVMSYLNVCCGKEYSKISAAFADLSDNQKQEFLAKVAEALVKIKKED